MPDATRSTTLFALAKVKTFVGATGATTDDALLVQIADGVSERIERDTQRKFVNRTVTEYPQAKGDKLFLRNVPVSSVTTVKTRTTLADALSTVAATEYEADLDLGILWAKGVVSGIQTVWPDGERLTEVVYVAGWGVQDAATLPADIYEAGLEYAKFAYLKTKSPGVIAGSINVGPHSITVIPDVPKELRDLFASWRKRRFL